MSDFRYARTVAVLAAMTVGLGAVASSAHRPSTAPKHSSLRAGVSKKHELKAHAHKPTVSRVRKAAQAGLVSPIPVISTGNISPNEIEVESNPADLNNIQASDPKGTNLYPGNYFLPIQGVNFPLNSTIAAALLLNTVPVQNEIGKAAQNRLELSDPQPAKYLEDWVSDLKVNTDAKSLKDGVALGIITAHDIQVANPAGSLGSLVTGANLAGDNNDYGHVNGARLVDGIAGADLDIFVKGGKENQLYTWQIQPNTVGSSKYDLTQAFLANSSRPTTDSAFSDGQKNMLFFGMERRGNNGTTEFEFEFNAKPPANDLLNKDGSTTHLATPVLDGNGNPTFDSNGNPIVTVLDPRYGYIPNRSENDVLFVFEMNGSSSSGSAIPHIYLYKTALGGFDLNNDIAGTLGALNPIATINQKTPWTGNGTPSAPWGFVNSKGDWQVGQVPVFSAAKGAAYFGPDTPILKNLSNCGVAYVQVRTRASVVDGSDLKDTTKIFEYVFGGPTAGPNSRLICSQKYFFDGKDSKAQPANAPLTYDWDFTAPVGVTLTGDGFTITGDSTTGKWHAGPFTTPDERSVSVSGMDAINGAKIDASLTVTENQTCKQTKPAPSRVVYQNLDNSASVKGGKCNGLNVTFNGGFTGGVGPFNYQWDVYKSGTATPVYTSPGTGSVPDLTYSATSDGVYYAKLTVSDSRFDANDPNTSACKVVKQTGTVCAIDKINLAGFKDGPSADGTAVNGHATYHKIDPAVTPCASQTIEWQISTDNGKTWNALSTPITTDTFTYSGFETDAKPGVASGDFTIGSDHFSGLVFTVLLRAHVVRTYSDGISRDSSTCEEFSSPITLKKVIGADP